MLTQSVGIRSLAVSFPSTIRPNQYWLDQFPDLFVASEQRQARQHQSLTVQPAQTRFEQAGIDLWLQEVTPYLADPFRGSVERRVLLPHESSLMLECQAAQEALQAAELSPDQIDLAIVTSLFPDAVGPGSAADFARALGLSCPAWSLESTCSSALVALQTAQAFVQHGTYRTVLIVVSHVGSRAVNEADTLSWSLGDGAGAWIVSHVPADRGILSTHIMPTTATCGAYVHELVIDQSGAPRIQTRTGDQASRLAETAVDTVRQCCQAAVQAAGVSLDQIACFAINTPTAWYASVCAKALGIDPARIMNLYPVYANIGPVFPMANLHHAATTGQLQAHDLVLVYTNGAAATAAATVMRWGKVALGTSPTQSCQRSPQPRELSRAAPISSLNELEKEEVGLTDLRSQLLAALPRDRHSILEAALLEWLAQARQLEPAQLNSQSLLTTVLDSLMAIVLRHRLETELQIPVPMEAFFGEQTIADLINFLLQQLMISELVETNAIVLNSSHSVEREIFSL
ncbi:3-oxoacyl-[acyl-carrier-protein] synthase III C-terminal domain-containing protein [Pantanalinema sp. GBBB05]|uniref:3-oxoacyl-[acyl-carrier-protein] synthase III C-terminal domain-containing protein n=1 Tax=Pantanalinema sp. GBBB05 TaxID=2604139 RepID=UPI001DCC0B3D|nr:3-oxoacyl-ACP synthase [Pantanalinema sp. GBBB05]